MTMIDDVSRDRLRDNWLQVKDEVARATAAGHRPIDDVSIIGVSKYVGADATRVLFDAGCHALGESRPQQLWQKAETLELGDDAKWHLIGHLQRNKIRRTLRHDPLIHSVDSARLLAALAEEAAQQARTARLLLEVNISGDEAKTGLSPEALTALLDDETSRADSIEIVGLMAMAGWGTAAADARRQFAETRQLRDRLTQQTGHPLGELSMGMSGDFADAIAEGATMVRIGSRLFEGVPRD